MWELQANLIPKFGYCSFKFDDVAQGKSLIQGQLAINFISPGYLIGVLMGKTAGAQVHHKSLGKSQQPGFSLSAPVCHHPRSLPRRARAVVLSQD